jgi:hypothetical protein
MPRTVCVVLTCDYPGCTLKPRAILRNGVSHYTTMDRVFKVDMKGWLHYDASGMGSREVVVCPDHAPEVKAVERRVESWQGRRSTHSRSYGERSAEAWTAKYPPPDVPEWLRDVYRFRAFVGDPPTDRAVKAFDALETAQGTAQ